MSVPKDYNKSEKEHYKISKDLEIEIGKIWNLKTITVTVLVGALGMIKKGKEKNINYLTFPCRYELQTFHFEELLIFL